MSLVNLVLSSENMVEWYTAGQEIDGSQRPHTVWILDLWCNQVTTQCRPRRFASNMDEAQHLKLLQGHGLS